MIVTAVFLVLGYAAISTATLLYGLRLLKAQDDQPDE